MKFEEIGEAYCVTTDGEKVTISEAISRIERGEWKFSDSLFASESERNWFIAEAKKRGVIL